MLQCRRVLGRCRIVTERVLASALHARTPRAVSLWWWDRCVWREVQVGSRWLSSGLRDLGKFPFSRASGTAVTYTALPNSPRGPLDTEVVAADAAPAATSDWHPTKLRVKTGSTSVRCQQPPPRTLRPNAVIGTAMGEARWTSDYLRPAPDVRAVARRTTCQ